MSRDLDREFHHQRLAEADSEFRLLRIQLSASAKSSLHSFEPCCELTTWRLNERPKYAAASYTWGASKDTALIRLNGRPFLVGITCYDLLKQAVQHGITGYLWVDAICINQDDDEEKSDQVAMMGDIYRNAENVYVFSGAHADDSPRLFDLASRYARYVDNVLQETQSSGALGPILQDLQTQGLVLDLHMFYPGSKAKANSISRRDRGPLFAALKTRAFFDDLTETDVQMSLLALYDFSERRYFSRLWIVQEILLGQTVVLLCGDSSVDFEDFVDFVEKLETHEREANIEVPYGGKSQHLDFLIGMSTRLTGLGKSLHELTDSVSTFHCFDARDRIYGVLGMVDWQGYEPIKPDYKKSALDLALQTISYMCPLGELACTSDMTHTDVDNWPIMSATQIATALGLQSDNAAIRDLLKSRRCAAVDRSCPAVYDRPSNTKPRIQVDADGYCKLFKSSCPGADFEACLFKHKSLSDKLEVTELPPGYEWAGPQMTEDICFRTVYAADGLCAKVPIQGRVGDLLLSFHMSAIDIGLVVRGPVDEDGLYRIVGQAVFEHAATLCLGRDSCSCSLGPEMHATEEERVAVYFDPEDLLLFVCQSLSENQDPSLNLLDWKGYLTAEKISQSHYTQVGEIIEDERLTPLRLATPVVRNDEEWSSFAQLTRRKEINDAASRQRKDLLEALRRWAQ
ncbi:HET-domain-containing protein [Polychaeton citri CBS 116435]|uniref:HET-domain-containing protein n=1 Tax=Polychaeton citri CBS 116435 TaxID=1314669 RepID=A0A9P4UTB6_9PEZI|nr:HET-domain-containing protein [Polychaeton citri CBS 116435]